MGFADAQRPNFSSWRREAQRTQISAWLSVPLTILAVRRGAGAVVSTLEKLIAPSKLHTLEFVVESNSGWPNDQLVADLFTQLLRPGTRRHALCSQVTFLCTLSDLDVYMIARGDIPEAMKHMGSFEGRVAFEIWVWRISRDSDRMIRGKSCMLEILQALPQVSSVTIQDLIDYRRFAPPLTVDSLVSAISSALAVTIIN